METLRIVTKPRITRTGFDPFPWVVLLPPAPSTPPRMAMCTTFRQTLQVLDAYLRFYREAAALHRLHAWRPTGAQLN